ncbi:MAG: hypothetical protein IT439_05900 [Phycisphaerales bacterium]|nr:hypothetical protein [Phycisphaerales bacterium]
MSAPSTHRWRHALIVGGSGMLAEVCLSLSGEAGKVSVLARSAPRLNTLAARRSNISPIPCDYADSDGLIRALALAADTRGAFDLAVCWVHGNAARAMDVVAAALAPGARVVHILPSDANEPVGDAAHAALRARHLSLIWHVVRLGFKIELARGTARARWLTHAEICRGVLDAIASPASSSTVGLLSSPGAPGPDVPE